VPLAVRFDAERTETISVVNRPALDAKMRPVPGAVIVGASKSSSGSELKRRSSRGMPREEKLASSPSLEPAATPITKGAFAYQLSVPFAGPEFAPANNTVIFLS
jgi:hypothetical protein